MNVYCLLFFKEVPVVRKDVYNVVDEPALHARHLMIDVPGQN